jgi:hypothetical protein
MQTRKTDLARLAFGLLTAALLAGPPYGHAQPATGNPPDKKDRAKAKEASPADMPTLEDMLAVALQNNPDIRVAVAKVSEAEAELNRTRLQVMHKVATFYATRKAAQAKVARAEQDLVRARRLQASRAVAEEDYRAVEQALIVAKAELELVEAEMPALLGKPPQKAVGEKPEQADPDVQRALQYLKRIQGLPESNTQSALRGLLGAYHQEASAQAASGTVADKIRKALDKPITVDFRDVPFSEVLAHLQDKTGIIIRNHLAAYKEGNPRITLKFPEPLPLRAVLQALEDEFPQLPVEGGSFTNVRFVVREYGLLVAPSSSLPSGAIFPNQVHDREAAAAGPEKNSPSESIEGQVKSVDPQSSLVTISVGSDDGLAKGHTLEVYRLNPVAKYLGRVRVLQTTPHEATAQPVSKLLAPIQVGDRVCSKIQGN